MYLQEVFRKRAVKPEDLKRHICTYVTVSTNSVDVSVGILWLFLNAAGPSIMCAVGFSPDRK